MSNQKQMFYQSHRDVNDLLQQAYWMAGKMKDSLGRENPNPLSDIEIKNLANSDKPYSYAFQMILNGKAISDVL